MKGAESTSTRKGWTIFAIVFVVSHVVVGWLLLEVLAYARGLQVVAEHSPEVAFWRAAALMRLLGDGTCAFAVVSAVILQRYCRLAMAERRLPPSGVWSFGTPRLTTGERAVMAGRVGLVLSAIMAAAGVAVMIIIWRLVNHFVAAAQLPA